MSDGSGVYETPSPYVPLPTGPGDPREQARTVFDSVAGLYDGGRPGYPPEALAALMVRGDQSKRNVPP